MSLNKIVAALLVVLFVLFTWVVILAWSAERNILDDDAYVQALEEAGFFELPYQLIRQGIIPQAGGLLLEEGPLSAVSGAQLEMAARELAPPAWLRGQLEEAVRDLLSVVNAPELNELPALILSLQEIKARALGEPGDRALAVAVQALPECAPGQNPFEGNPDVPVCKPPDAELAPFLGRLKAALIPLVERVPDTYRVSWQPEQRQALEDLQRAGRLLEQLRVVLLLLLAMNLALLGLVWLLAVRSPAEWLRWTGGPLLLLGLLTVLAALLAPRVVEWGLDSRALWSGSGVPSRVGRVLEAAMLDMTDVLFEPARFVGGVLTVAGLLLLVISPLFPGRRRHLTPKRS